jgi:2-oxoisovalerate dehydrogenase E2 component (dihydrolipoyl transacylase)
MTIFKLPDLGEGLPEAEVHEWYVSEGDVVKIDQPLVAMETAKAVVDIPSPVTGRIKKLHGKPGDVIPTGEALIEFITDENKDTGTVVGVIETSDAILMDAPTGVHTQINKTTLSVKATPAVRMLAKTLGVDLNTLQGTGPAGSITADDVKKVGLQTDNSADSPSSGAAAQVANLAVDEATTLHGARRSMAQAMSQAHAQVVPVTLMEDADLYRWQDKTDATLRLVRAIVVACQTEPALNAHFYSGTVLSRKIWPEIHLGIAVDTPSGLYVPVIKDAANQSPEALRATINSFKEKAKQQAFLPSDLNNATITLSNFGTIAGRYANPIVIPPTVAIIGIGKTRPTVVALEGKPAVHPVMPISLTFDHRAATGGEAARFMRALIKSLEEK